MQFPLITYKTYWQNTNIKKKKIYEYASGRSERP